QNERPIDARGGAVLENRRVAFDRKRAIVSNSNRDSRQGVGVGRRRWKDGPFSGMVVERGRERRSVRRGAASPRTPAMDARMSRVAEIGLSISPVGPSISRERRRLDSASGPRIRPRTMGPAGMLHRLRTRPMTPKISITTTVKMLLVVA